MTERYNSYNAQDVLNNDRIDLEETHDFWSYWKQELSPYFEEEYLTEELDRYKGHQEGWPEGENDFKRTVNDIFGRVKILKELESSFPTTTEK